MDLIVPSSFASSSLFWLWLVCLAQCIALYRYLTNIFFSLFRIPIPTLFFYFFRFFSHMLLLVGSFNFILSFQLFSSCFLEFIWIELPNCNTSVVYLDIHYFFVYLGSFSSIFFCYFLYTFVNFLTFSFDAKLGLSQTQSLNSFFFLFLDLPSFLRTPR